MNNVITKIFIRTGVFFLVVLLAGCGGTMPRDKTDQPGETIQAEALEEAKKAKQRNDFSSAYKLLKPLAEQGNADAQYNLGVLYNKGEGVPQSYAKAVKWFKKAAKQGLAVAQYNLGIKYANGQGVGKSYSKAVKWYKKAADQGHFKAQHSLGFKYEKGEGVDQDYEQAIYWYQRAIESDRSRSKSYYNLGRLYGLQGQYDNAIENLNKAIENNPRYARAYNEKAWILATCPNEKYRDGDKAIELAKKAVELSLTYPDQDILSLTAPTMDTLAAAYAEAGRYEDAITTQEKAISVLRKENEPEDVISEFKERLTAYQAHKPWRD